MVDVGRIAGIIDPHPKRISDREYLVHSPLRTEKEPSLHITYSANARRVLMHDFGNENAKAEDIVAVVDGLEMRDLFDDQYPPARSKEKPRWQKIIEDKTGKLISTWYNYHDIGDKYAKTKVRFTDKDFLWGRFRGGFKEDWWEFSLSGKAIPPCVFGSSVAKMKSAVESGKPVFFTEGERDADSLIKKGQVAITTGGATSWTCKIGEETRIGLREFLRGADVIICGDNDVEGRRFAEFVKSELKEVAKRVEVIYPYTQDKGGDVSDFLNKGGTVKQLLRMADEVRRGLGQLETYEPSDRSDIGQAVALQKMVGEKLLYSPATGFLVYDGTRYQPNDLKAQGLAQGLTDRQLEEAKARYDKASDELTSAVDNPEALIKAKAKAAKALQYLDWVLSRRRSGAVQATLREAMPMVEVDVADLDKDGFLLNTPDGTIDLRTGQIKPHDPKDRITKIAAASPGEDGKDLFDNFLDRVTCGDKELKVLLQEVAGMCAIGHVYSETLTIAYGSGGNGKSTLFNALAKCFGDYAGQLSAEVLTTNSRKNKSPEYAELRGKRIVLACELEEGMRLDTSVVKKLCSTDPVYAERKYKDPFSFIPSHSVVLFTNHLPKVGTNDSGTWDRLTVIPFNASFRGQTGEIKDYSQYLADHAGGAIMSWIVEGAKRFIENGYRLTKCKCVEDAISEYQEESDWLQGFIDSCCEVGKYSQPSGELYGRYRQYTDENSEYRRSLADFKQSLTLKGFETRRTMRGAVVFGLRLTEDLNTSDSTYNPFLEVPWSRHSMNA